MLYCISDPGFEHTRQVSTHHTLLSHMPSPTSFFLLKSPWIFFLGGRGCLVVWLHTADTSPAFSSSALRFPGAFGLWHPRIYSAPPLLSKLFVSVFLFTPHHCFVCWKSYFPSFCSCCLNNSLDSFNASFGNSVGHFL